MLAVTIGCDPELFIKDMANEQFVSAHGRIPGTKKDPFRVDGGAVQIDGTALEFNIDPASTKIEFVGNVHRVMSTLGRILVSNGDNHLAMVAEPVAEYDPEYFRSIPREALELGCEPDYNAWTAVMNPLPDGARHFRTGSGHIHIGWTSDEDPFDKDHYKTCCEVAQQLDYYLGLPSLVFDQGGIKRRELYGKAGAFRPKPYGVEYRTLSNAWLRSEALISYVYDQASLALKEFQTGEFLPDIFGSAAKNVIDNNRDPTRLLKACDIVLPEV